MRQLDGELPDVDASSRTLGARAVFDIPLGDDRDVSPGSGGMSVSPDDAANLPKHRRPIELDGNGLDPVFVLDEVDLHPDLYFRPDPDRPSVHGFIEPVRTMNFDEYQAAIWRTHRKWKRLGS